MKKHVYTLLFLFAYNLIYSQDITLERNLISNGGGSIILEELQIDYSFGEVLIGQYKLEDIEVSNGFLQQSTLSTSIRKHEILNVEISLFPNPTNQYANILIKEEGRFFIQLFNPEGKMISQKNLEGNSMLKLDMSPHPFGLYTLEVSDADGNKKALQLVRQ